MRASEARAVNTGDGQRAQAALHRGVRVGIDIRHIDRADLMMEIGGDARDEAHDALVALEHAALALRREHRESAGADALEVDQEHAAQLVAMGLEELADSGVAVLGCTGRDEPDVVTEQLVVAERGDRFAQIVLGQQLVARGTALPAVVVIEPVVQVLLTTLLTTKQATTLLFMRIRCRCRDGVERSGRGGGRGGAVVGAHYGELGRRTHGGPAGTRRPDRGERIGTTRGGIGEIQQRRSIRHGAASRCGRGRRSGVRDIRDVDGTLTTGRMMLDLRHQRVHRLGRLGRGCLRSGGGGRRHVEQLGRTRKGLFRLSRFRDRLHIGNLELALGRKRLVLRLRHGIDRCRGIDVGDLGHIEHHVI